MRRALPLVMLLALVAPGSARAGHDPGCGGSWSGTKSCLFAPNALPLRVFAEASRTSGTASVHVSITTRPTVGQVAVTLLECSDAGNRYATCGGDLGDLGDVQRIYGPEVPLRCVVEGVGSGEYFCSYPPPPA